LGTERYVPSLRNKEAERRNGCREYSVEREGRERWAREMGILRMFGEMRRGGDVESLDEGWKHVIQ
jgi:hypothetical protein